MNADPDFLAAQLTLGTLSGWLGAARGAIAALEDAYRLAPHDGSVVRALADALRTGRRLPEALAMARRAVELEPESAAGYLCLGDALLACGTPQPADDAYQRALALDPQAALAECGRGAVRLANAQWQAARDAFERALALDPHCAEARYNVALLDLRFGNYGAGFHGYPAIMKTAEQRPRYYYYYAGVPLWDGTALADRRLVVAYEQGLGNQLMMARFFDRLPRFGESIAIEAPPPIHALLRRNFPGLTFVAFTHWQPLDVMDVHVPLMQLPTVLRVGRAAELTRRMPYLTADATRVAELREALQLQTNVRHVGIAWHGNRENPFERWRAAPLPAWAPLAAVKGVRFHSLQFGATRDELAAAPFPLAPTHEHIGTLDDTAALAALMDLVITIDTSTAHLAGALGRPTWMPNSLLTDYRWGTEGGTTPWYPTLRMFRQRERDAWAPVFEAIAAELGK